MAKRRPPARETLLTFIDGIMAQTVPLHEALCDEGKCDLENQCAYCKISELLMTELAKF